MTQTTGAMSPQNMYVGFSTNGSSWTEASGYANAVAVGGGERQTGEAYTFDGNTPIVKYGKLGYLTVTVTGIYTEAAAELYNTAQTAYEAGSAFYVRWSPGGGDAGDLGYTTSEGTVINPPYPAGAADTPDPIMIEIVVNVGSVTESTIGTAGW